MFGASAKKSFIIGAKQVKNAIISGRASKIYVASDCDEAVSAPVVALAEEHNIPLFYISTRKELGEMCGINVKSACAAQTI